MRLQSSSLGILASRAGPNGVRIVTAGCPIPGAEAVAAGSSCGDGCSTGEFLGMKAQKTGKAFPPRKTWSIVRHQRMFSAGHMAFTLAVGEPVAVYTCRWMGGCIMSGVSKEGATAAAVGSGKVPIMKPKGPGRCAHAAAAVDVHGSKLAAVCSKPIPPQPAARGIAARKVAGRPRRLRLCPKRTGVAWRSSVSGASLEATVSIGTGVPGEQGIVGGVAPSKP